MKKGHMGYEKMKKYHLGHMIGKHKESHEEVGLKLKCVRVLYARNRETSTQCYAMSESCFVNFY